MDQEAVLLAALAAGLDRCQAVIADHGGLLASLWAAGLLGGLSHCVGMCGPFVLAQVVSRLEALPAERMGEFRRLSGAALAPYHLGRLTTYALLGSAAGGAAGGLMAISGLKWGSAALLVLAALFFLGYGVRRLGAVLPWLGRGGEGWWSRHVGRLARPLFERPVGWRGYGLGVALGFLPCGLLYAALAAAAASGGALSGAFAMAAFGLGTVPGLLAVGMAGHLAGQRWQAAAARVAPLLLVANAGLLTWMAWRMVA